ncbi:MAG: ketopantoate reductase C-terminal domain-containing protein, partial [Candidatus Binataceae bacterium]
WYKLMGNNGTNPVCALSLSTIGEILGDEDGYELSRTLMAEAIAVGRAEGANVTEERIELQLEGIKKHPNAFKIKPSTLQDLEKGKRLEHDGICGAVVRAAARHNIPVPATKTVFALLKMIDARIRERN